MTKQDVEHIQEVLSVIVNQPLRDFTRSGSLLIIDFGELIEADSFKLAENGRLARDENGKYIRIKEMCGKYGIHAFCSMRFTCENGVIFTSGDIFAPIYKQPYDEEFDWDSFDLDSFDWHTIGNTSFDELLAKHFDGKFCDHVVKSVEASPFGDLTISFKNDCMLELFAEGSRRCPNWSFGEANSYDSLAVSGNKIESYWNLGK